MARSVGDYAVKAVGVTAEPEVTPLNSRSNMTPLLLLLLLLQT